MAGADPLEAAKAFLAKHGLPFELEVGAEFHRAGLNVVQHGFYTDSGEGLPKIREIDVHASIGGMIADSGKRKVLFTLSAVVECKARKDSSWIGVEHHGPRVRATHLARHYLYGLLYYPEHLRVILGEAATKKSHAILKGFGALHSSLVTVKTGGEKDSAFEAVAQALKGAHADISHVAGHKFEAVCIAVPVIVTDNVLYSCRLDERKEPVLTEVDRLMLSLSGFLPAETNSRVWPTYLPVVTKRALPAFVANLRSTFRWLNTFVHAHPEIVRRSLNAQEQERMQDRENAIRGLVR